MNDIFVKSIPDPDNNDRRVLELSHDEYFSGNNDLNLFMWEHVIDGIKEVRQSRNRLNDSPTNRNLLSDILECHNFRVYFNLMNE